MAGNIRGITIEFAGDTTKLDKALREIKNSTKDIDKELRQVDKALKFNPTSVELWRQKQDLLKQKIKETENNLKELKNIQAQMDAKGVDKNSEAYRRVSREIIETESKLKHFKSELQKVGNVKLRALSEQVKNVGANLEDAGRKMAGLSAVGAAVAASIGAVAYKSGQWADDLNTLSKRYSLSTEELQKYGAAADLVDVSVETIAKSHLKLEKSMASASKGTGSQAEAFEKLGVSVTDADGNLRDGDTVWQETIAALGTMSNETERDALAMQIMGKSAAELNPLIEDGGETYKQVADTFAKYNLEVVDQETLDRANEFNDQIDTIKAVGAVAFQTIGTQLAGYLAPALEKVVDWVGKFAEWLSNLDPRVLTVIGVIGALVAGIAPLLLILGKIAFAVSSIMSLASTLGVSIGALAGPIGIAIAAIAAIIAIGVLLYKNWDKIKAFAVSLKDKIVQTFTNIKNSVVTTVQGMIQTVKDKWSALKTFATDTFNRIKDAIVTPIKTAIDKVKSIIDKVKGFFPINVGKILKGIKIPKFSISGKFSLNPPSIPKISMDWVNWYKDGGIFDSPSLIGVGEAGKEAVVPLDKLWNKLDNLQGGETNIVINVNGANKDPVQIAQEVKRILIKEVKGQNLAFG